MAGLPRFRSVRPPIKNEVQFLVSAGFGWVLSRSAWSVVSNFGRRTEFFWDCHHLGLGSEILSGRSHQTKNLKTCPMSRHRVAASCCRVVAWQVFPGFAMRPSNKTKFSVLGPAGPLGVEWVRHRRGLWSPTSDGGPNFFGVVSPRTRV